MRTESVWRQGWRVAGFAGWMLLSGMARADAALDGLNRAAAAATLLNYSGVSVYHHGEHVEVLRVLHPALPDCPGHNAYTRDFLAPGGLFGFTLKDAGADQLVDCLLCLFAVRFVRGHCRPDHARAGCDLSDHADLAAELR